MKVSTLITAAAVAVAALLGLASNASAQATRTWVSGVGDDANPCSRTAPCKTFAGAISKTATGGEINCLDPGGFGGVTITKAITIYCDDVEAGVLVSGTNAIVVNAPTSAAVVLRGLDIEGLGTGLNGVRFIAGGSLHVDDCLIRNFSAAGGGNGIAFVPSNNAKLLVTNSTIWRNAVGVAGAGILIAPTGGAAAEVVVDNVVSSNNNNGLHANSTTSGAISVTIVNSVFSLNTGNGIAATGGAGNVDIIADGATASDNAAAGIRASGATAIVRLSNSNVSGNANGLSALSSGQILSFVNNRIRANAVDGAPTGTLTQQ
ncbi:right-handed parallel beta-helix repeat-containing protein [Mesorhizobium sp. J428]|uniref:right-handed parallel beta-helix repeat-containing protein n=1 Tax=Mesorhizobium sp. J428 TaxID=2898440 RepID=UPI0021514E6C|nr:right-handed parallel beta-helix repeat-containing protein [Mesorhizobium sp. J428]MCR5859605.1 right-handed parallel beta-helix repeat-containing protein [Mesorhizobium sp. J428]